MKKAKWLAILLLALGLTVTAAACDGGGGTNSGDTPNPSDPPITDPSGPDTPDVPEVPDTPSGTPIESMSDLGEFSRVWTSFSGDVLDLTKGTLQSSLFNTFAAVSYTGKDAEMTVNCKLDGRDYVLSLEDGALALKREGSSSATLTFYVSADEFAGAWKANATSELSYFTFSSDITRGEGFAWRQLSVSRNDDGSDIEMDSGYGVTRLTFGAGGAYVLFAADSGYGYDAFTVYPDAWGGYIWDDGYFYQFDFLPYAGAFRANVVYMDEEGNTLAIDSGDMMFNDTTAEFDLMATEQGSGLLFTVDGKDYLMQIRPDGGWLLSDAGAALLASYNAKELLGVWSDGDGDNTLSVQSADKVRFNDEEYDLSVYAKDGRIEYAFTAEGTEYTLSLVPEAPIVFEMSENGSFADYYILNEAKATFFDSYDNNTNAFTIHSDYTVTFANGADTEDGEDTKATFTYIPELQVISVYFTMTLGEGTSTETTGSVFLVNMDPAGAYWLFTYTGDSLAYYSSMFTTEYKDAFLKLFDTYLDKDTEGDFYTTGGTDPVKLEYDFVAGTVTWNGVTYDELEYSFETYGTTGYPTVLFYSEPETTEEDGHVVKVTMTMHSLRVFDMGLLISSLDVTAQIGANGIETSYGDEQSTLFVSDTVFQKHLNHAYVYHGPLYDEQIIIGSDGSLTISTTDDATDSDKAIKLEKYDYVLHRYQNFNKEEMLGFVFADMSVYMNVWESGYASIMDLYYAPVEYQDFVGTYHNGSDVLELDARGQIVINGKVYVRESFVLSNDGNTLTVTYNSYIKVEEEGTEPALVSDAEIFPHITYTAVFTKGESGVSLTVSSDEEGSTDKNYSEFGYTPYAFVGTYTVGKKTVVVTSTAIGLNLVPELSATVDGFRANATLALDANGKQTLTLTYTDTRYEDVDMTVTVVLTLDGNTIALTSTAEMTITVDGKDYTYTEVLGTGTATANVWSYKSFLLDEAATGNGYTLTCVSKEDGEAPMFTLKKDDKSYACLGYTVSIDKAGNKSVALNFGDDTVTVTVAAEDGTVSVTFPSIPLPPVPPPPPPPAPPLF